MCRETHRVMKTFSAPQQSSTAYFGCERCKGAAKGHFLNSKMKHWFARCNFLCFLCCPSVCLLTPFWHRQTFHSRSSGFLPEADTPVKSRVTHCFLWKALVIKSREVLIQTLAVLQLPSRGPEMGVNAMQWFNWPLNRPGDEVTVLHYLVYGNARPVVSVMFIKFKVLKLSRKTF